MIMLNSMVPMPMTMLVLMDVSDTSLIMMVIVSVFPVMMMVVMMMQMVTTNKLGTKHGMIVVLLLKVVLQLNLQLAVIVPMLIYK